MHVRLSDLSKLELLFVTFVRLLPEKKKKKTILRILPAYLVEDDGWVDYMSNSGCFVNIRIILNNESSADLVGFIQADLACQP